MLAATASPSKRSPAAASAAASIPRRRRRRLSAGRRPTSSSRSPSAAAPTSRRPSATPPPDVRDDFSVAPVQRPAGSGSAPCGSSGSKPGPPILGQSRTVYGKQLEEADVLVINEIDTVSPGATGALRAALRERYPRAVLFEVSAKTGAGSEPWFAHILASDDESRTNRTSTTTRTPMAKRCSAGWSPRRSSRVRHSMAMTRLFSSRTRCSAGCGISISKSRT